ncbi:hypothetical protein ES703_30976 [subsurface metagenome]
MKKNCPLCTRELKTTLYYEDNVIWIVDCLKCHCPMAVIKRHNPTATPDETLRIRCQFAKLGVGIFDDAPRKIKDHYHAHWRRK